MKFLKGISLFEGESRPAAPMTYISDNVRTLVSVFKFLMETTTDITIIDHIPFRFNM